MHPTTSTTSLLPGTMEQLLLLKKREISITCVTFNYYFVLSAPFHRFLLCIPTTFTLRSNGISKLTLCEWRHNNSRWYVSEKNWWKINSSNFQMRSLVKSVPSQEYLYIALLQKLWHIIQVYDDLFRPILTISYYNALRIVEDADMVKSESPTR